MQICEVLYKKEIQTVLVEGGTQTLQSFIDTNLWDEAYVFIGVETLKISKDLLKIYENDF